MPLTEILRMALTSLVANKLRAGLTMLGIAIGVFSVVGVMTAITAMERSIESGLSFLGSNIVQLQKFPVFAGGGANRERFENRRDIDYLQATRFKELMAREAPEARVCFKLSLRNVQAQASGRYTNPNLIIFGTDENFLFANQFSIAEGRNLTPDDVKLGRDVILIGNDVKRRLFPNESPLGQTLRARGATFTIVGVFAEKGSSFGVNQDNICAIPISAYLARYGRNNRSINVAIQSVDQASYAATVDKAVGVMRTVRQLEPEQPNDFEVFSNDSLISVFNDISRVVSAGAFVISAIALLAAGVGIMNIMLVSVTERTKEIGVRKSIGARRSHILRQFLVEAVVISQAGGLIGILLGAVFGNVVATLLDATAIFPWVWAGVGVGVCAAIGVGFGLYPAWKAAVLDPIEALRYE